MSAAGFWDNPEKAQQTISLTKPLNNLLKPYNELADAAADLTALCELAEEDASLEAELEPTLARMEKQVADFELKAMLDGIQDASNAYIKIQAGTGGTEACDWAQMLLRMYTRWAERNGFSAELVDEDRNEEAGIRSATLHIIGDYAYGHLQGETGVHRLVRISPFDANARRQTSFAALDVLPELDDSIVIEIKPDDLVRQTFRSGGPGGQHQNKTESGVRYIHKPTGIAAESRTERSQHKNKAQCWRMLRTRIFEQMYEKERAKRAAERKSLIGSGDRSQRIRTYNFPQNRVTDHRINLNLYKLDSIMAGRLGDVIRALMDYDKRQQLEQLGEK
jgi:peptide chain release factor 2